MTFFGMLLEDFQLIHWAEFCGRIVLACVCGALVGAERRDRFKDAGVRTHSIICCTAALLMILSKYGFTVCPDWMEPCISRASRARIPLESQVPQLPAPAFWEPALSIGIRAI